MLTINGRYFCESCYEEINTSVCPYCGYCGVPDASYPYALVPGTVLADRYCIGRVLGKGGFGITYLAYDVINSKKVAVKEYFPDGLVYRVSSSISLTLYNDDSESVYRNGAEKFYKEAVTVSRFRGNANIINVYDFFYSGNTVYFTMEYLSGGDLKRYVEKAAGRLSERDAIALIFPLLDALSIMHAVNTLHRDISPDNIFITDNSRVVLIDFGAARQIISSQTQGMSMVLKHGYAPLEQYQKHGEQGPWTDIYALGATLWFCLFGKAPENVMSRMGADEVYSEIDRSGNLSPNFKRILKKMLAVNIADRYKSVSELKAELLSPTVAVPVKSEKQSSREVSDKKSGKALLRIAVSMAAVLVVLGAVVAGVLISDNLRKQQPSGGQASPSGGAAVFSEETGGILQPESTTESSPSTAETAQQTAMPEQSETVNNTAPVKVEDYSFTENGGKLTITGYNGTDTEIVIPDNISGKAVTAIANEAFIDCYNITKVTVPQGVTAIGNDAFYGCSGMKSISLPDSLSSIGERAFYSCSSLTEIRIPYGVTNIKTKCFADCLALAEAVIPRSVTVIGEMAFLNCTQLGAISLPASVNELCAYTFEGCDKLSEVKLAHGLTSIQTGAFKDCVGLSVITLPSSVTYLGEYVFMGCSLLSDVSLSGAITVLPKGTFIDCKRLAAIILPGTVKTVSDNCFDGCEALSIITITNTYCEISDISGLSATVIINAKTGSTAQKYAEEHGNNFVPM